MHIKIIKIIALSKPLRLYLQLHSCRLFPPRTFLQQWTPINIYVLFYRGAFPSFVYKTKLQCNEENLSMTYQKERARHTGRAFSFRIYIPITYLSPVYHRSVISLSPVYPCRYPDLQKERDPHRQSPMRNLFQPL